MQATTEVPMWKRVLGLFVGLLLACLLLWWASARVSWSAFSKACATAEWGWLGLGILLSVGNLGLKALRWSLFFTSDVGMRQTFPAMMTGYFFNLFLPGKSGELARVYAFSRQYERPFAQVLATIVVERLLDALCLLGFVGCAMFFLQLALPKTAGLVLVALVLSMGLAGLSLVWARVSWVDRGIRAVCGCFPAKIGSLGVSFYEQFQSGLRGLKGGKQWFLLCGLQLSIWGVEAINFSIFMGTFGISIDFAAVVFVMGAVVFGSTILATPGQVGSFQIFAVKALVLFQVAEAQALGFAVVMHGVLFGIMVTIGGGCVLALQRRSARKTQD
ncbi:MAG: lysylphosphatidylglycerol synthase transmembrane domain-containing protein [Myxococcota bacterium]